MSCDIIIAVWNKLDLTRDCIESIIANTSYPYQIVAIDNGSDEPTKKYLESLRQDKRLEFHLIRNEKNLGNTVAGNQGMRYSNSEFVCNLDNDTIVTPGWLTELVHVAMSDPKIGLVTSCLEGHPRRYSPQAITRWVAEHKRFHGQYRERGVASGFCCLIKRELINTIGVWDEAFSPGYFEDTEYSLRAKRCGYRSVAARAACVYHRGQASFRKRFKNKELEQLFARNRALVYAMYGKPVRASYIITRNHSDVFRAITERVRAIVDQEGRVYFFTRTDVEGISQLNHANIHIQRMRRFLFRFRVVLRILVKKKKFDEIYCDDRFVYRMLLLFKKLHRGHVYQDAGNIR